MEEVLPAAGGGRPRGGLGAAGGAPYGRRSSSSAGGARALHPRAAGGARPRGRRPSPASCRPCPRGRRGTASGPLPHAGGARPRSRLGVARSAPPHAGGAPARQLDATSRARPRGRLNAPCGARPRVRLGAPPLAAGSALPHTRPPASRAAPTHGRGWPNSLQRSSISPCHFDSIVADVDLSMKSWLCRLRSGGPCLHRRTHPQPASNPPLLPAATTQRQPHHRRQVRDDNGLGAHRRRVGRPRQAGPSGMKAGSREKRWAGRSTGVPSPSPSPVCKVTVSLIASQPNLS
ncbi:hypothetical protein GQ55_3G276800 [Panicum hallii var. hallii]|uniref:Uncharacterized protein n=1 Tax=Panicum hallii var. hallii TaxID=1504633 RepID=A0A2T7EE17_9POAL|nr:hypothetical protein GQ55_3G276800 [Panicum hallii var. hallii]